MRTAYSASMSSRKATARSPEYSAARHPWSTRFASATWETTASGAPRLADAIVAFDCRIADAVDVGTHAVLICEVIEAAHGEVDSPLLYFARAYHSLPRS